MNFKVSVLKMEESSGNIQFFGRAYNQDTKESLDYCCAQTKHYPLKECLERVWFEVGFLARFFGIPNSQIELLRLTDEEKGIIVNSLSINHTGEKNDHF